jgi:hypothetical protein
MASPDHKRAALGFGRDVSPAADVLLGTLGGIIDFFVRHIANTRCDTRLHGVEASGEVHRIEVLAQKAVDCLTDDVGNVLPAVGRDGAQRRLLTLVKINLRPFHRFAPARVR